jgi:hypothetical protein
MASRAGGKRRGEPGWQWRRVFVFPLSIWACVELHSLQSAADTRVNETIAWGWIVLLSVLALGYTGFATVQDIVAIWRTRSATPYDPFGGGGYQQQPYPQSDPLLNAGPASPPLPPQRDPE